MPEELDLHGKMNASVICMVFLDPQLQRVRELADHAGIGILFFFECLFVPGEFIFVRQAFFIEPFSQSASQ